MAFWLSTAGIIYSWLGYPLLLRFLAARYRAQKSKQPEFEILDGSDTRHDTRYDTRYDTARELPNVSLIIAAYGEEEVIGDRLDNACTSNYPSDKLEILIGVDGDIDRTGQIVADYPDPRVKLLQYSDRRGKASVLNDTATRASGDVLVFSDANTMFSNDAIGRLAGNFDDPDVGGVCGQLELIDYTDGNNTDGAYWKFENFLKKNEASIGGLLGFNGAIYAIRRELYQPIPTDTIVDDFLIGMRIHLQGRKLLYDPTARANEESAPSASSEFSRRVRIGSGNIQSLRELWPLLNPLRGAVAFTFFSHKILRWMVPIFMLIALTTNIGLVAGHRFYGATLAAQVGFYLFSGIGSILGSASGWRRLLRMPSLFVSLNLALLIGMVRLVTVTQTGMWSPTSRSAEDVSV